MNLRDQFQRHWATWLALAVLFLVLALIIYLPLFELLQESLHLDGDWSLANFQRFFDFENPTYLRALWGSVAISVLTVLGSALVGVPLAIFFSRFQFPGRKLFGVLMTLPLLLPPLVGVIAFYFLMSETGIIPRVLQKILNLETAPLVLRDVPAILLVHIYSFYVFFYLFSRNALAGLDRSLEEAASGLGASRFMLWRRVILPQLQPALLGASMLVFMNSMASFTAPYMFGGNSTWRFLSLEIYKAKLNGDLALSITQAVILAGISVLFLFLMRWYGRDHPEGRGSKGVAMPPRYVTNPWQKFLLALGGSLAIFFLMLPQLTLVLIAFVKNDTWTWQILPDEFTLNNFASLFTSRDMAEPWLNSLWMSALATAAGVFVAVAAAFLSTRPRRSRMLNHAIDASVMLPWAVPGTVIAIALIIVFDQPFWFTGGSILIGSAAILPLAYFIRHLPIQFRAAVASFAQLDPALEEAAQNLGASWTMRFRRVTLPLILPGIVTGGMMAFVIALGEFVSSILLYTYSNRPLSIAIFSELRLFNLGSAAAYSVLLTVLIGLVMWLGQKWSGTRNDNLPG